VRSSSSYSSMSARRRDLAILRALGAKRRTVFSAILGEAAIIGMIGAVAGYAVYFLLYVGVTEVIRAQTGVVLPVTAWHPVLVAAPLGMIGLCLLGGLLPAVQAYRLSVADTLAPTS